MYTHPAFEAFEKSKLWVAFWSKNWYSAADEVVAQAEYQLKYGNDLEALSILSDKYALKKPRLNYYVAKARIYESLANYKDASDMWEKAIEMDDKQPDLYFAKGVCDLKAGNRSPALKSFNQCIALQPNEPQVYRYRSEALAANKDYSAAIADLGFYLFFYTEDSVQHFTLGKLYSANEQYQQAILVYNQLLQQSQAVPEWFIARGDAYYKVGTYKYAERDFGMALDINPRLAEAWYGKGLVRWSAGNATGACADWQKAANLGSRDAKERFIKDCF